MKIPTIIFTLLLTSFFASAQIERKPTVVKADSATAVSPNQPMDKQNRRDRLKDLDLTREQQGKLKEIRQSSQAAKQAIENNTQLTDAEKKKQLRALQKDQAQKIQSILTEEQKVKFREGRKGNS
ncbi:MAG: hypothetical protein WBP16_12345 [Ferruginibacter sp.]